MAEKPETRFKNRIRPKLEALPNSYWVKIDQVSQRGVPDFMGCLRGQMVLMELKASEKQKPTRIQEWHLQKAANAGALAFIVNPENWESTYELLQDIASGGEISEEEFRPVLIEDKNDYH